MSNYHFGDDYDLNYYPQEASDSMGGVDWDKVERVEIEFDVYVKERTCELEPLGAFYVTLNMLDQTEWGVCSNCGTASPIDATYCCECGAKVIGGKDGVD